MIQLMMDEGCRAWLLHINTVICEECCIVLMDAACDLANSGTAELLDAIRLMQGCDVEHSCWKGKFLALDKGPKHGPAAALI